MRPVAGKLAAVTGAASGIGRAVALELARRGARLALADRDADGLKATARDARAAGAPHVSTHAFCVTDGAACHAFAADARAAHAQPAARLYNVAGATLIGRHDEVSGDDVRWLFEVNVFGVMETTRAFLPQLLLAAPAQIAVVSSIFGIVAPAEQAPYAATKFAVRGWAEALRHELRGAGVGVTLVHPGGVRTRIAASARVGAHLDDEATARASAERFARLTLRMPPERAGRIVVRGVEWRRPRVLVGWDARALDAVQRIAPGRYWAALGAPFAHIARRLH